ncbi:MAG: hypothetical protein HYV33_02745 [Candidatus Kerfeldbacteria bacterium]|nr:hypothetical protein [Candidatus Kerfeldbacteria bacterium]
MKLYRDILSQGWQYTLQTPHLWILGFFVALMVGSGGEIDRYLRYINALVSEGNILNPQFWTQQTWFNVIQRLALALAAGDVNVWLFVVLLVVSIIAVVTMMMMAQGGLIYAATHPKTTGYAGVMKAGFTHAVPLFFLHILEYLIIAVPVLVVSSLIVASNIGGSFDQARLFLVVVSSFILLPVVVTVSLVSRYAANYIVVQGQHLGRALHSAWRLFWKHWLVSIEMALVVFSVALMISIFVVLAVVISVAPYFMAVATDFETPYAHIFNGVFVGVVMYVLGMVLFTGIFTTWQSYSWTLLFQRLLESRPTGTLLRVFQK